MNLLSAPEFAGDLEWLNTDRPLHLRDLQGKIVLLGFWTFSCVSCIQMMPDLHRLVEHYPELVVIGVHSTRYESEKVTANIGEAILHAHFEHPVVVDRNLTLWRQFGISSWPTFILIDPEGNVVGKMVGEGVYERLGPMVEKVSRESAQRGILNTERMKFGLIKDVAAGGTLYYPGKIAADLGGGRLFIADSNHHRILAVRPDGRILAAAGSGRPGRQDGSFTDAAMYMPQGLVYDAGEDALYVADAGNHLIRKVSLQEETVETVAGTGLQAAERSDGGWGTDAALNSPWDLTLLGEYLYIAMAGADQIWRMHLATREIRPYAGTGVEALRDGPLVDAAFAMPTGITTDGVGTLYVADSNASAVRHICRGMVTTLIGHALSDFGDFDTVAPMARINHPVGISYTDGIVYIADTKNHKVKWLNTRTSWVLSMAGSGTQGYRDGLAGDVRLNEPGDLVFLQGLWYIVDTGNHAVRVYDPDQRVVSTLSIWK
ncbi:redoxin domain-containing protein [Methanoculleus sp. FWC-SCC1]|uniref:Redoxin domain-containing protein n=1 Tax=Methanoculleus frigidifontis TaxID=2584085 RepID=A0ABT8M7E6_9EURY|nr:thioredoxin-like domain-containing protein [Methanoculleus sp. FWC-SCC1]MDN7023857.1 redoxin domain-containing protein [Methanoculleus sp. FWC-SCC1]